MRALSICLGLALSLGFLVGDSKANITFNKTNTAVQTFSSGGEGGLSSNGSKSVTFLASDFNNHPTADIISLSVAVEFAKIGSGNSLNPYYNEIRMVFSKAGSPLSTTLIQAGASQNPSPNGFGPGPFRNVNDPPNGFDGTVTFSSDAGQRVNANQNVIPNTPGTAYRPASTAAASVPWDSFVGQSAIGTFTLDLFDIDGGGDASLDPLVFRSMTVTITAVPEPSSFAAFGLVTVGGVFIRRRRARG